MSVRTQRALGSWSMAVVVLLPILGALALAGAGAAPTRPLDDAGWRALEVPAGGSATFTTPAHHGVLFLAPPRADANVTLYGISARDTNESWWGGYWEMSGSSRADLAIERHNAFAAGAGAAGAQVRVGETSDTLLVGREITGGALTTYMELRRPWDLRSGAPRAIFEGPDAISELPWTWTVSSDAPVEVLVHAVPMTFLWGPTWEATAQAIPMTPAGGASASILGRADVSAGAPLFALFSSPTGTIRATTSVSEVRGPGYAASNQVVFEIENGAPGVWTFSTTQASAPNGGVVLFATEIPDF